MSACGWGCQGRADEETRKFKAGVLAEGDRRSMWEEKRRGRLKSPPIVVLVSYLEITGLLLWKCVCVRVGMPRQSK